MDFASEKEIEKYYGSIIIPEDIEEVEGKDDESNFIIDIVINSIILEILDSRTLIEFLV